VTISKDALLAARFPEADVELPTLDGTVRVRALSRAEVFRVQKMKDVEESERRILAFAMLDPVLTVAEVQRWQDASPAGELEPVVDKIRELSGLTTQAEKEAVLDFRGEPDSGV